MTCSTCSTDVPVTIVVIGRRGETHLCRRCYFAPVDVVVPVRKKR
jgi:hypothetical protein